MEQFLTVLHLENSPRSLDTGGTEPIGVKSIAGAYVQ